jgi:hypothetical protein
MANNPDTVCCEDTDCDTNHLCIRTVDDPDAITSYCIPKGGNQPTGGEQEFQDECGKWTDDTLKTMAKNATGLICGEPVSCEYQLANSVAGFECCDDSYCKNLDGYTNGAICLLDENIKSSRCVDCKQFNKQCQRFWDNDYLMDLAEKRCGKICYLNACSENPTSTDACKNHSKKCGTRVELNTANGYYYQCRNDDGKCKIDSRNPDWSCDPKQNSLYDTS